MKTTLVIATLSVALSSTGSTVAAFSVGGGRPQQTCQSESTALHATPVLKRMASWTAGAALALTLGTPALADEYGKEVEAPTLFTGETVMICTKRGPLGACLESVQRTAENDNDKAKKYFQDPSDSIKRKDAAMRAERDDSNPLIQKLRQQTEDNKEKNDLYVQLKTFENDQSATFGPFDRQVVILNTDGKTFTLLENPQAMRLKDKGFIQGRSFVKQPTAEEIEDALTPDGPGLADVILGKLRGSE